MSPLIHFIIQASLTLICVHLLNVVMRKIRQPMVIAEIVAGIALGPSLLGWLAPSVEATVFPADGLEPFSVGGQIGLLMFMFLIGLEFEPALLRSRARAAVTISYSSILLPFGLGLLLAMVVYPKLSPPGVPFQSFAMFMGVSMSITAFPVLARILSERGMIRTEIGAMALACAAVGDITAWCILAFILAIVRATSLTGAAVTVAMTVGFSALMLGVVRPLVARLADRAQAIEHHLLVAILILMIFASSTITEMIGIHAIFGAFLCGTVIPRDHGLPQLIIGRLEDLVSVFMLPLFFAFSGLRTEIGLLNSASDWLLCGLVIAIAVVGKFGGSVVAARFSGYGWRQSSAIGILMNTRGLVELVVLNIGYDLGLVSKTLFTMLVIMALVTTFMTSPLLPFVYHPTDADPGSRSPGGPSAGGPAATPASASLV
jgi:Kef-type K+ transport system membrane component KefB